MSLADNIVHPSFRPMLIGRQYSPCRLGMILNGHEYYAQPKLNGINAVVGYSTVPENHGVVALNKHGKPMTKFEGWREGLRYQVNQMSDSPWRGTIINGELVKLPAKGGHEWLFPFDILYYKGKDVRRTAFTERLRVLRTWVQDTNVTSGLPSVDPYIVENTRRILPQHIRHTKASMQTILNTMEASDTAKVRKDIMSRLVPGHKNPVSASLMDIREPDLIEGVVLKHQDAMYINGIKNNKLIKARWL
tara:strand:+ start:1971 stop:2714 length:744 start_codon:yes stop_codon:yes gene_type:complete